MECEQKFTTDSADALIASLTAAGAQYHGSQRFEDSYWDTEAMDLLRHDHWLRQRAGVWELKRPSAAGDTTGQVHPCVSAAGPGHGRPASGGGYLPQPRWAVCATGAGAHQGADQP